MEHWEGCEGARAHRVTSGKTRSAKRTGTRRRRAYAPFGRPNDEQMPGLPITTTIKPFPFFFSAAVDVPKKTPNTLIFALAPSAAEGLG